MVDASIISGIQVPRLQSLYDVIKQRNNQQQFNLEQQQRQQYLVQQQLQNQELARKLQGQQDVDEEIKKNMARGQTPANSSQPSGLGYEDSGVAPTLRRNPSGGQQQLSGVPPTPPPSAGPALSRDPGPVVTDQYGYRQRVDAAPSQLNALQRMFAPGTLPGPESAPPQAGAQSMPQIGATVTLKNGKRATVTRIYQDGTFDAQ